MLTGGPGAGKTASLELIKNIYTTAVSVIPEAATILFGGGFPRTGSLSSTKAAQRSIFYIQKELENYYTEEFPAQLFICDRGTIDTSAYWPGLEDSFWKEVKSTKQQELDRYYAVIHLRVPSFKQGYNDLNPLRIETAEQAAEIDLKILQKWKDHPRRFIIESGPDFISKAIKVISLIKQELQEDNI